MAEGGGGQNPRVILDEFIEMVLQKRQIGRIASLCFHRVKLFTGGSRQYYGVPAVEEQVLRLFTAFPDMQFEVERQLTDSLAQDGAAAVMRLITTDKEETGFVMVRTARGRIISLRLLFGGHTCLDGRGQEIQAVNDYPPAGVVVSAVPHKVYMPHEITKKMPHYSVLEEYMYQLAGLPRIGDRAEVESSQDLQVCLQPGSVYFADVMVEEISSDRYACIPAWFKGLQLPQGNVTASGVSFLELGARGLQKDIRVFDDDMLGVVEECPEDALDEISSRQDNDKT